MLMHIASCYPKQWNQTALEFTTGTGLIVAQIQHTGRFALYAASKNIGIKIALNDTEVIRYTTSNNASFAPIDIDPLKIIIPPFTKVKIEVTTNDTQNLENYVSLTGRVYGEKWRYQLVLALMQ